MKSILTYINETKYFTFTKDERDSLTDVINIIITVINGDSEYKDDYECVIKELSPKEINQLNDLYDCLSDNNTWPKINRNIIVDDIPLLKKILGVMDDNSLLDFGTANAYEKICE